MQAWVTFQSAPGGFTQSSLGLAQFDQAYFTATNGWISHSTSNSTLTGLKILIFYVIIKVGIPFIVVPSWPWLKTSVCQTHGDCSYT